MHLTEDYRKKKEDDDDDDDDDKKALGLGGENPLKAEESVEEDDTGGD